MSYFIKANENALIYLYFSFYEQFCPLISFIRPPRLPLLLPLYHINRMTKHFLRELLLIAFLRSTPIAALFYSVCSLFLFSNSVHDSWQFFFPESLLLWYWADSISLHHKFTFHLRLLINLITPLNDYYSCCCLLNSRAWYLLLLETLLIAPPIFQ